MNKRILIAAPIHMREKYLPYYLNCIYNLEYDKKLISLYFIINNSTDNSESILRQFKEDHNHEYENIILEVCNSEKQFKDDRNVEIRDKFTYSWLSLLRNKTLDKCDELNCDFLLSVDSDIMMSENTLKDLLFFNKDIVSGLIWNGHLVNSEEPWRFPNILKKDGNKYTHISNYYVKNPSECPKDKLLSVDFTGAIFLISKDVCKNKNIRFAKSNQGEDEAFGRTAIEQGYEMWNSPHCFNYHLMSEEMLDDYIEKLK